MTLLKYFNKIFMKKDIIKNAKSYVNLLLSPLNKHYYHSYWHSIDVMQRAIYLAENENLSLEEIEILALAGLFHDTWFVIKYDNNEPFWAKIAKNYLKTIWYPEEKIKLIEEIILATSPNYKNPKNIYEKIIKDADMDSLWRDDFEKKANDIKKEIEEIKKIKIKDPEWKHSTIQLLSQYDFKTWTQKRERTIKKQENLKKMIEELKNYCSSENSKYCDLNWFFEN